jgi:agmatine deiminase
MLTWPHQESDWRPWLGTVEPVFVDLARHIVAREHLLVSCRDAAHRTHIAGLLRAAGIDAARVAIHEAPANDTWARDHGPLTVLDGDAPLLLDFTFNGWGEKFAADLDNTLTRRLHERGAFGTTPLKRIDMVLEGGSLEVDGTGTLLTTARCLLSPQRNPQLNRAQIEHALCTLLGAERVLWLEHGHLEGDDTDAHIDTLARFCDPYTIAYVACDDPQDSHYRELKAMEAELRDLRTADAKPYRLVPLPWPRARYAADGRRLPATYANFLVINGAVLVPTYSDPADVAALKRVRECFPDREVIGVPCGPLIHQYGSLHCITMQLPAGVL